MKDAKQSKRVYRCDMNDASLFLECYEELNFGGPSGMNSRAGILSKRAALRASSSTRSGRRLTARS
jgi:hypothetical protein